MGLLGLSDGSGWVCGSGGPSGFGGSGGSCGSWVYCGSGGSGGPDEPALLFDDLKVIPIRNYLT